MALVLNGSGTIAGLSAGGLPDGSVTADDIGSLPAGSVLQVVYGSSNTSSSTTTAGSGGELTAVSASITPSSSSNKVLLIGRIPTRIEAVSSGDIWTSAYIYRGATAISPVPAKNHEIGHSWGGSVSNADPRFVYFIQTLDSPSTTSATTYSIKLQLYSATGILQVNEGGYFYSTITLMEIAA